MVNHKTECIPKKSTRHLDISFGMSSMPIVIESGIANRLSSEILRVCNDAVVVIDEKVDSIWSEKIFTSELNCMIRVKLPVIANEQAKTMRVVSDLLDQCIEAGAMRTTAIIAVGGGLTGNVAGMVAGLLYRGVKFVQVPTTLLAMSDSVISAKQAVNGLNGKNLFGLFRKPTHVIIDPCFLSTLPREEFSGGMVECCKNTLAFRAELLNETRKLIHRIDNPNSWEDIICLGIEGKRQLLASDEREANAGIVLEYGHTIGHALEFEDVDLCHGHAVGFGMRAAARIARLRGWIDDQEVLIHDELIKSAGVPACLPIGVDLKRILNRIQLDNKRGRITLDTGQVAMVLLKAIGQPALMDGIPLVPVDIKEIEEALQWLINH